MILTLRLFAPIGSLPKALVFFILVTTGVHAKAVDSPHPMDGPLPTLTLSVLQFGTAHWELVHIQRRGLDRAHGFDLDVRLVANLAASRIAVASSDVDGAVADLLWTQARFEAGMPYLYLPFSSSIGDIMVPEDSSVESVADLVGKRIGVAGGPDSKGWVLLKKVARQQGYDLDRDATVQYAAPPLLSQALKRRQLDVLVTYWHFAARLRGEGGVRSAFSMSDLLDVLGLDRDLPVLGYVFRADWAERHRGLVGQFGEALSQAKNELAADPTYWNALRPLMRAGDDRVFDALRSGFVEGIPKPLDDSRIADLQHLLKLVGTPPDQRLPAALFFRSAP